MGTKLGSVGLGPDGFGRDVAVSPLGAETALAEVWFEKADEIFALTPCGSSQSKTTAAARRIVLPRVTKKAVR